MITFLQILIIVFAVFALSRTIKRLKQGNLNTKEFYFWSFLWIVIIVVALIPQVTDVLSGMLGIGRGFDLAIYVAIILLFYLVFRLMVKIDKLEHEITKIVRTVAINNRIQEKKVSNGKKR